MPPISTQSHPTSLKLPVELKTELELSAERAGLSLHAYMLQTLADSVRRSHQREEFARDSITALSEMKISGTGYELHSARAYFSDLANHRKGLQGKPQDLEPTRLA